VWAAPALALAQLADAAFCVRPLAFVARCLERVRFPRRHWRLLPPIKAASGVGLVIGLWVPGLGAVTAGALVVYFVLAVASHVRVRDVGLNLAAAASYLAASAFVLATFV
jgi:hypothetical protein